MHAYCYFAPYGYFTVINIDELDRERSCIYHFKLPYIINRQAFYVVDLHEMNSFLVR
jgi:hypothetical protein